MKDARTTKKQLDTMSVLRAYFQYAMGKDEPYTDRRTYYDEPDRDSPWYGTPGVWRRENATKVRLPDEFCIPLTAETANKKGYAFGAYLGPISVLDNNGKKVTDQRVLRGLAAKLIAHADDPDGIEELLEYR